MTGWLRTLAGVGRLDRALKSTVPLDQEYPEELRTPLVDWATRRGQPGLEPPPVVRAHLERVFADAAKIGRRHGFQRALLLAVPPAAVALTLAVLTSSGAR